MDYKTLYNLRSKKRKKTNETTLKEVVKKCEKCVKEPVKIKQEAIFQMLKVKK
jgi:hypothetical protein